MHLLAFASTAVHIALCSLFWQLARSLYSSFLSTYILLLRKILELSASQMISLLVSLIAMYKNVKWALCQDLFLKDYSYLYISSKVISTICLFSYSGSLHISGSSVTCSLRAEIMSCSPPVPSLKSGLVNIVYVGAGEPTQQLGAHAVLAVDLDSVASTYHS